MKLRFAQLALFALLAGSTAGAQCMMCYTSASAASQKGQRAITRGVVMLLIPPVTMMATLVTVAFRYGRKRDQENELKPQ